MSKVKIRKELGYGVAAGALLLGAGYILAIGPQADATAQTLDSVEQTRTTNEAMAARIPALKAELDNVADQVASLQELSRAVPAQVDQPGLYAELDAVARSAGLRLGAVTLETPTPLAAPVAATETANGDGEGRTSEPSAGEVLASYKVTMQVEGDTEEALAFLAELEDAPRLSVVGNSELSISDGDARLTVTATLFLQQVEVDAIIAQIESLTALDGPPAEEAPAEDAPEEEQPQEEGVEAAD